MIKFDGKILQFGFGAVGKSFYEKVSKEIKFNENNYYVVTRDKFEFEAFVNMGGIVSNFMTCEITRENYKEVFGKYLESGDLLIDFADTVGTRDICEWCALNNIMYINTGETDWPDHWYSIFEENELKCGLREKFARDKEINKYPIVLQHGNNPGLVSHFVKLALSYIVNTQHKKNKRLKNLLKNFKFNELARELGVKMIHVNDIDLQTIDDEYKEDKLFSTWCTDSFWFELLSEATCNIGTHELIDYEDDCNVVDRKKGFLEFKNIAADKMFKTYYPGGAFEGNLVPHEETITIARALEVKDDGKVVYRPTVMFIYRPCEYAKKYLEEAKVNTYPIPDETKPMDCENGEDIIIRGYRYPKNFEIVYKEKISSGTEYVGVLLMGDNFEPVWVGNRIEQKFLYKDNKNSYWQTPTITPVAMSALAAVCWMIKNKEKGGLYFPDDILECQQIVKMAEKYISKTIYKTFSKEEVKKGMDIKDMKYCVKDFLVVE